MPMSTYMRRLRACWGGSRLLVPSVAGIVRDGDGRVLLVQQRETGEWSTPGGAIELEDTPADAVVREVWSLAEARCLPLAPWLIRFVDRLFDQPTSPWFEPATWSPDTRSTHDSRDRE